VKQDVEYERNLSRILKKARSRPREWPDADNPVAVLVLSFLLWESTPAKALAAYKRVVEHVVDFNDLRVSLPHETMARLGERYPLAQERAHRLRASLNDLYNREHAVSLDRLRHLGKKEVKRYLDSLEGITPYVSSRLALLSFDVHGIPADESLRAALIGAGAADPALDLVELGHWLTRHVRAGDGAAAHATLQDWCASRSPAGESSKSRPRKSAGSATRHAAKTTRRRVEAK
jgi:hypothetical protein